MLNSKYSVEQFINELANEKLDHLGTSNNLYKGDNIESVIRRHNLLTYLKKMQSLNPTILLLGEAPGYKGCKLTGIPFTSEKILAEHLFFKTLDFKFINEKRESEQSATIVWDILQNFGQKPLIWNIFPFHPHHNGNQKNNRTPNKKELELGKEYLVKLLELFKIEVIIAAGKKPKSKLDDIGICSQYIRHPANGGKKDFNESIQKILG